MNREMRDIFICHASEDKEEIVRPMVEAFNQVDISCWYDEAEIRWGDSITEKVNEGLRISRYVIVVFSTTFIEKNWPNRELNAVLNLEASSGQVKVLPLLVGSSKEISAIIKKYPLLNDKRYLPWDGDLRKIVNEILTRLGRPAESGKQEGIRAAGHAAGLRIPLPKIKKKFTQREKDIFLRDTFQEVKQYFRKALSEMEKHYTEVESDFAEVHNFKFICNIYVRGEISKRCKIWIGGGLGSSDAIAYQEGQFNLDSDNSYNDMLTVVDDEHSLGFKPSGMWFGAVNYFEKNFLNAGEAVEYLWRRFTDSLD